MKPRPKLGSQQNPRTPYGSKDPERLRIMREMRASGMTLRAIGEGFGISRQCVNQILHPEKQRIRARQYKRARIRKLIELETFQKAARAPSSGNPGDRRPKERSIAHGLPRGF